MEKADWRIRETAARMTRSAALSLPTRLKRRVDLDRAVAHLAAADKHLARALDLAGPVAFTMRRADFASLLKTVIEQQVSTASARAIWARLVAGLTAIAPDAVMAQSDAQLRAMGLSGPKIRYCRSLSEAVASGDLALERLSRLSDEKAKAALTSVTGIGRWTAEIYLIFCLGRADVWPAGDIAVQAALQSVCMLSARPNAAAMDAWGERWRPLRGAAALILWNYYRHLKRRPAWT